MTICFICVVIISYLHLSACQFDVWEGIPCDEEFQPDNCNFEEIPRVMVEDYDRCAPALLNLTSRNYFLGASGRRLTYRDNFKAFKRYRIIPKLLRDVSMSSLEISTLGQKVAFPIGIAPVATQKLANPLGEIATVRATSNMDTVMIVSTYASTTIEEIAMNAKNGSGQLWIQTFIFKNRSLTVDIVTRAERAGYKAVVLAIDFPIAPKLSCNAREEALNGELVNLPNVDPSNILDSSETYNDLRWLRKITKLPIVARGVLSGMDARMAIRAGASAISVSNHGGRQVDSAPATIDVLPDIVRAVSRFRPRPDVYLDGGVRNGWDIYKAIGRGAKMVFIGRPTIWGLVKGGQKGVEDVLSILTTEFNEAMRISGSSNPSEIAKDSVIPAAGC